MVGRTVRTFMHLWDLHVTGYRLWIATSARIENHGARGISYWVMVMSIRREFGTLCQKVSSSPWSQLMTAGPASQNHSVLRGPSSTVLSYRAWCGGSSIFSTSNKKTSILSSLVSIGITILCSHGGCRANSSGQLAVIVPQLDVI